MITEMTSNREDTRAYFEMNPLEAFSTYQILSDSGYVIDTRGSLCVAMHGHICLGMFKSFAEAVTICDEHDIVNNWTPSIK